MRHKGLAMFRIIVWTSMLLIGVSLFGKEQKSLFPAVTYTKEGTLYGYINDQGNWVTQPVYDSANAISEGRGIVSLDNLYGAIDATGREVIANTYQSLTDFKEGRSTFVSEKGMGVLDLEGKEVTTKYYDWMSPYQEGLAVVSVTGKDGNSIYGYIDRAGKEVIAPRYSQADDFQQGKALVRTPSGEYQLISEKGKVIKNLEWPIIFGYQDHRMIFRESIDSKLGYLDESGKVVITPQFETAEVFQDGVAVIGKSPYYMGQQGLIDQKGKFIYKPEYNAIRYLGEKRVAVGKPINPANTAAGSVFAIGDLKGNLLTDFIYYGVSDYKEGKASVYDQNQTFFITLEGKPITTLPVLKGSGTLEQVDEVIIATIDGRTSYLSPKGEVIYEPNTIIVLNPQVSIKTKAYKPNLNYLVYYPQVIYPSNAQVAKQINEKLRPITIEEIEKNEDYTEYSYEGRYNIQFYNKNLFIPNIIGSTYYFGGAHPLPNRTTPVIDLETGKFYGLEDLFVPGADWKAKLNHIIQKMAQEDPQYEGLFSDVKVEIGTNQPFYVDQENLYIYYAPYEIGPYAMGFVTFKIPYSQISDVINQQGDLWKAYH